MKSSVIISLVIIMVMAGSVLADIYKCKSPSGVTIYSDEPCGKNAKLFIRESAKTVDGAVAEEIEINRGPWSERRRENNIAADARRIGATILPNQFFTSADVIHIAYSPSDPPPSSFPRATPHKKYGKVPGWVVCLKYHSSKKQDEYELKFRFDNKKVKQASGDSKYAVLLRTISVKKNGKPFFPDSMRNVQNLKFNANGEWKYLR